MLPNFLRNRLTGAFRFSFFLLLFAAVSYALPVYAQANLPNVSTLSAQDMLTNIASQIPNLMQMITAFAYVIGMYFIVDGIIKLKHFGESRSMMSQEHGLKEPLILIAVGALLLYLPTSVQIGMSTFWTNPNPYGYQQTTDQWASFMNDCFLIVQFVGTLAFIRGLVILSHLGGSGQQGAFGRGLTHIIAGIFCINIYQFVQVILVTLGIQSS
jgi:intracellular multiplication protein IcmC